eukprot:GEMP01028382.1.p1 GENE.GEMP01028382.1~~GEMP01028382.1.p1  ORF type:complete len:608 (+),score=145.83 GEMP01028382.1:183-2006(+)
MVSESFAKRFAGKIDVVSREGTFAEGGLNVNHELLHSLIKNSKNPSKEKTTCAAKNASATKHDDSHAGTYASRRPVKSTSFPRQDATKAKHDNTTFYASADTMQKSATVPSGIICDNASARAAIKASTLTASSHRGAQPVQSSSSSPTKEIARITAPGAGNDAPVQSSPTRAGAAHPMVCAPMSDSSVCGGAVVGGCSTIDEENGSDTRPMKPPLGAMAKVTPNGAVANGSKVASNSSYAVANGYARVTQTTEGKCPVERWTEHSPCLERTAISTSAAEYVNAAKQRAQEDTFAVSAADYATAAKLRIEQESFPLRKQGAGRARATSPAHPIPLDALDAALRSSSSSSRQDHGGRQQSFSPQPLRQENAHTCQYRDDDIQTRESEETRGRIRGEAIYIPQRGRTLSPKQCVPQAVPKNISGRSASVSRPNAPPALPPPIPKSNERMVKNEQDKLFFSKKPRPVDYVPAKVCEYQAKYTGQKVELTSLGPDLGNEDLLVKKARAAQIKEFSKQLRDVNRHRITSQSTDAKPKPKELSRRQKALEFASSVPKPKIPESRPLKIKSSEGPAEEKKEDEQRDAVDQLCDQWRKHLEHKNQVNFIKSYLEEI